MTERVPGCNRRIFTIFPLPAPSQARCSLASSPIGRAKGGCAAGVARTYPLRRLKHIVISVQPAGNARPLALPLGELARLKAVTERVYAAANMEKVS